MTHQPLVIVADRHIWEAESAFADLPGYRVDLRIMEQGEISAAAVADADILLVRSSTKVDGDLLRGSRVRFVATATVGDDHIDLDYLSRHRIAFASAAGSSTGSVVEYLTTVLLVLHCDHGVALPDSTLGVIGVGRIGGRVAERAAALGMRVLRNDPPLWQRDPDGAWHPLETLLREADLLTIHTPLLRDGAHPTYHLLDAAALRRFRGWVVINAARGAVVDNRALLAWLDGDSRRLAVLDCWEGEPRIDRDLLAHPGVVVATPHIAGHSLDGKAANTQFVYDALCRFLQVQGEWHMNRILTDPAPQPWPVQAGSPWRQVAAMARARYPIDDDVSACRALLALPDERFAAAFTHYRRHYPVRRSWARSPFLLEPYDAELAELATRAGLAIARG